MNGVDLNTVRELLRHKSLKMTLRYAHLSPGFKQAAIERLDTYWTPSAKNWSTAPSPKKIVTPWKQWGKKWWTGRESNPWPLQCHCSVLPAELPAHKGVTKTLNMNCPKLPCYRRRMLSSYCFHKTKEASTRQRHGLIPQQTSSFLTGMKANQDAG